MADAQSISWEPPAPEDLQRMLPQSEISGLIGRGGMGAVYRGRQIHLDRDVAVKALPESLNRAGDELNFAARFKQEARAMAALSHPGIVTVHDFGETSVSHLYFVMEFIDGMDIHQYIHSQGGRLPRGQFKPLSRLHSELDLRLDEIVSRALQPDPEDRYPMATASRTALVPVITSPMTRMEPPRRKNTKSLRPVWISMAAVVVAGTLAVFLIADLVKESRKERATVAPASEVALEPLPGEMVAPASLPGEPLTPAFLPAEKLSEPEETTERAGEPVPAAFAAVVEMDAPPAEETVAADPAPVPSPDPATGAPAATKDNPFENSLGMKFVPVPIEGGPSDGQTLLFSVWETRVKDYEKFIKDTRRSWSSPGFPQTDDHPAVNVSWEDAVAFCTWLTWYDRKKRKIGKDQRYRLPTDHEWSCAVGIGKEEDAGLLPSVKSQKLPDAFPWGREWPPPRGAGNYCGEETNRKWHFVYDKRNLTRLRGFGGSQC